MAESRYASIEPQFSISSTTKELINEFRKFPKEFSQEVKDAATELTDKFKNTSQDLSGQFRNIYNVSTQKFKKYALPAWIDLPVTHPLNTITKRLQNSPSLNNAKTYSEKANYIWEVGFCKSPRSVYCGVLPSMGNKFLSRNAKFLVQDVLNTKLNGNFAPLLQPYFSDATSQFIIGSTSGFITGVVCTPAVYPVETIKVRLQLNKNIAEIFNIKNVKSIYNGLAITTVRDVWASSIFFGLNSYCLVNKDQNDQKSKAIAAGIAGLGSTFASQPFDLLKTRKQGSKEPINLFNLAKEIWVKEGPRGFFKGIGSNLAQAPLRVILPFVVFTYFKDSLKDGKINQPIEVVQVNKNNKMAI